MIIRFFVVIALSAAGLLYASKVAASTEISVEIVSDQPQLHGQQFTFAQPTQLSEVYTLLEQQGLPLQQIDWTRMRLVSATQQGAVEQQRQQLVQELYQLYGLWRDQPQRADLVRRVAEQVARWPVVGAEPIGPGQLGLLEVNTVGQPPDFSSRFAVSPKQASYQPFSNVYLHAGSSEQGGRYQLILPTLRSGRNQHPVLGVLWVPFQIRYNPDASVFRQMRDNQLASRLDTLADNQQLAESKINGEQRYHPLLTLTQQGESLSYGSVLLVLFNDNQLPKQFKTLNQQMLDLLRYFSPLADWQGFGPAAINTAMNEQPLIDDESIQRNVIVQLLERNQPWQPTTSDYGSIGLLQTPTARMAEAGTFSISYHDANEYRHMALNLQLFPWLETTIRYNDIRTRLYSQFPGFSGDQTYKDRGIDVKVRLQQESHWLPEISAGLRDAAGTGLFAGEYVVASKNFGQLDFSVGVGWGYLGKNNNVTNPFCRIKDDFCRRPTGTSGSGGLFETDKWLHGSSAWFGGIEYQFEQWPISLKLEYDPNNYQSEPAGVAIKQNSRFNFGIDYRVTDSLHAKVSFERGNTVMFGASITTDLNAINLGKIDLTEQRAPVNQTDLRSEQLRYGKKQQQVMFALRDALENEAGFRLDEVWLSEDGKAITMLGNSFRYRNHRIMLQRVAQIAASELPNEVTQLIVVEQTNTMLMAETEFDLVKVRRALLRYDAQLALADTYERRDVRAINAATQQQLFNTRHVIGWPTVSIKPFLEQSFGGPEDFYMYMLGLDVNTEWALSKNSFISATLATSLTNNYDEFNFLRTPTRLPPVRTRVREYVSQSDVWLRDLMGVYQTQVSDNVYTQLHGGYFELMFAGVGGEVLYRPLDQDWSFGVDVNYARQRDPYDRTGLLDYAVWTGHASLYYQPKKWLPNSLVQIHAGQFLAGDRGVQVTFEHKFDSGIITGAFAAKTNVSAADFGEGSFNKGFFISIPFDLLQLRHSRGRGTIAWVPITRDGGQMLMREHRLIGFTDDRSRFYTD